MGKEDIAMVGLFLDFVIGAVTVAALFVAISQAREARAAASNAERAVARERRIDYELGLLGDIYKQWQITRTQHLAGMVNALIRDSSNTTDLRFLRVVLGVKAENLNQGVRTVHSRESAEFNRAIEKELDEAINRRLEGRFNL